MVVKCEEHVIGDERWFIFEWANGYLTHESPVIC